VSRVYILLVNWNGWADTLECLESLLHLDYPDLRVVVVDNASTDGSCDYIRRWVDNQFDLLRVGPRRDLVPSSGRTISFAEYDCNEVENRGDVSRDSFLTVLRSQVNLGFAGGNNIGLRFLQSRGGFSFAWLLNNDTVVEPSSLKHLIAEFTRQPQLGICGSTLLYYADPLKIQALGGGYYCRWIGLPWLHGRWRRLRTRHLEAMHPPRLMNYVVGASMLVSTEFVGQVGLMNEDYFLFFEETDWAWRGRKKFALGWAPRSLVYHKVGSSIGTSTDPRKKSVTCDFYALRNRLLFTKRFCRVALPTVWLGLCGALLLRLLAGRTDLAGPLWGLLIGRTSSLPAGS